MSTENKDYFKKYKQLKEKYKSLAMEMKQLETIMESCRVLLSRSLHSESEHPWGYPSPLLRTSTATKRKISFSAQDDSDDSDSANVVENSQSESPYGLPIHQSTEAQQDPDETFFDDQQLDNKLKDDKETTIKKSNDALLEADNNLHVPAAKTPKRRKRNWRQLTPVGHVCRQPRCELHQPFFCPSKKELKKLSPKSRKMATTKHLKSPKGLWDLDLPSTQEIHTRNQSQ